jgi:CheY-like chemotaxis protein
MEAVNRNPMHGQPPVVLYVDDNLRSSRFLTAVLEECGFDVITANDPVEALGVCKNVAIDLVLLDYDMSVMTGSQLAEELKFLVPNVPVVLLAGHTSISQSELVFVDGYFGPDTTLDDLIENLRTLVAADTMRAVNRSRTSWSDAT